MPASGEDHEPQLGVVEVRAVLMTGTVGKPVLLALTSTIEAQQPDLYRALSVKLMILMGSHKEGWGVERWQVAGVAFSP